MTLINQLKKQNPTLYSIHKFIVDAEKLGYGEIEFAIKTHNYKTKTIDMAAVKPQKNKKAKGVTKRIVVKAKKK